MRPAGPAIEPGGNPGTLECVLEKAGVALRGTHEDGDFVKGHAGACFLENAAGDLDALAAFAWRRKQSHVSGRRAFRRAPAGEEVAPQRDEILLPFLFEHFRCDADRS